MNEGLTLEQWENRLATRQREHRALTEEIKEIESCIAFARSHFTGEDRQRMELDRERLELLVQGMRGKFAIEQAQMLVRYAHECGIDLASAMERYLRAIREEL